MVVRDTSILFIDAYDSFTNNIISLLATTLACSVRVIHIDSPGLETDEALRNELRHYDAVVCGPGPGNPSIEKDVGLMKRIWALRKEDILPVLGICLGFQSLCLAFGGQMQVLSEGLHGRVRKINHIGEEQLECCDSYRVGLFDGVGTMRATLYHSLYVKTDQNTMTEEAWEQNKWMPICNSGPLLPLAWAGSETKDKLKWRDDRILMAVRHETKPFWGLQYHPESICTNKEGKTVIKNWFQVAQKWNKDHGRHTIKEEEGLRGELPTLRSLLSRVEDRNGTRRPSNGAHKPWIEESLNLETVDLDCHYESQVIDLPDGVAVPDVIEKLQDMHGDQIVLESTNAHIEGPGTAAVRGRYSMIGLNVDEALRIEYHAKDRSARILKSCVANRKVDLEDRVVLRPYGGIWPLLADFLEKRRIMNGDIESPFWGGFMGFTTYELGLEGIAVDTSAKRTHTRPDLCFAWITKSLVFDHLKKKIYIQQLVKKDLSEIDAWVGKTVLSLRRLLQSLGPSGRRRYSRSLADILITSGIKSSITIPNNDVYESKVRGCQEQIRRGESYELCLTDQTEVVLPRSDSSHKMHPHSREVESKLLNGNHSTTTPNPTAWTLYKSLRHRNPAPFASYLRLGALTFISGSPERFLKWSSSGTCELRPMKGTVKKTSTVSSLAQAEALLQVPKEQAENLMIVDLVRHDLHGVCGPGNVTVPRLMVVEEYANVFQMITVVEGKILPIIRDGLTEREWEKKTRTRHTGLDVLAASLPPGSMTGAPKKRSCEILQGIEGHERSLYSGVVGYMDVGGRGDFSVNIRCMYRWDDEGLEPGDGNVKDRLFQIEDEDQITTMADAEGQDVEVWHIGAGGAVTALSTPVAEREEMQTKLAGTLGLFGVAAGK